MRLSLAAETNCPSCRTTITTDPLRRGSYDSPSSRHASRPSALQFKGNSDAASAPMTAMEDCCAALNLSTIDGLSHGHDRCSAQAQGRDGHRNDIIASATRPTLLMALLLALVAATPAAAVRVDFSNCLPDTYRLNNPPFIQWVPLYADAVFDTTGPNYNLLLTVWGNVTGMQNVATLPPPNSPYWTDPEQTNGKIVESPSSPSVATTLVRRVNVLTYEPWNNRTNFCTGGLVGGICPLAPTFGNVDIPHGLPSFNMSHDFLSSYAFASFSTTFLLINGDTAATNIGCVSATITPDLGGSISAVLKFVPLVILLFAGFAVPFAGIWSPWGTTDIFHWSSNYGRDNDLLRLVTPGFGDCLQYLQFSVLTGALTLDYPGFFQPIVSQVGWSSLMFNESLVTHSPSWKNIVDGIYVTKPGTTYGLAKAAQLIGMSSAQDIWAGMMVWLCVIIAAVIVLIQVGFAIQWIYRKAKKTTEEDLRAKNIPFVIGNIVRIVFNFMLIPIVALSCFQFVIANDSPAYTVALAAVTLALLLGVASWLLYVIISTRPKSVLFDDLPTVLRYGPLYNTYGDEVASFAIVPFLLNILRGIAIGAVQSAGVAQVVLLAICEVIGILMIYAFRPYQSATSMNIYHTIFSVIRLIIIMLMVSFIPSLGVTEGPKGWIGYVILFLHACVLLFGFFLGAIQTIIEVVARMLGAGGDDITGMTRGGLSKIFGMRQLSRRVNHRQGPSRASQLSTMGMLDAEDAAKSGYVMPSGRVRSGSAASLSGVVAHHRHRSSSALGSMYSAIHRNVDSGSSYMPGTPGEASTFSFIASPTAARHGPPGLAMEASDPYYRPPRRRRDTEREATLADLQRSSLVIEPLQPPGALMGDSAELAAEISRGGTPATAGGGNYTLSFPPNGADYATREVDFYYGVRGPALNSEGPNRKLGTGPADPTGPAATAASWVRTLFGGKTKEKGKGFEVVRSARMPPGMVRNGGFGDETPPEGIPVAMGVIRNGPIDSDDDEPQVKRQPKRPGNLLTENGDPQSDPDDPDSPVTDRLPRGRLSHGPEATLGTGGAPRPNIGDEELSDIDLDAPNIPRKSSKRHSAMVEAQHASSLHTLESEDMPPASRGSYQTASENSHQDPDLIPRLPFDRSGSQRRPSSRSSLDFPQPLNIRREGFGDGQSERPTSIGRVPHHSISRIDPSHTGAEMQGSTAEVVDDEIPARV